MRRGIRHHLRFRDPHRRKWLPDFRRARLRARLAGESVLPVSECTALSVALDPLRVATAKKLGAM
jgi:hypothetical protein